MIPPKDKAFLDIKLVQECMDAHAKRVSIAFDIWKRENNYTLDYPNPQYIKLIISGDKARTEMVPTDDVYNQFIESIIK